MLFRLTIEEESGQEILLYGLFEPRSSLPPRGGVCESYYETNSGVIDDDLIVSGLSFVVIKCGGWMFSDGDMSGVGVRMYYDSQGAKYPRNQTGLFYFWILGFGFWILDLCFCFCFDFCVFRFVFCFLFFYFLFFLYFILLLFICLLSFFLLIQT